jgi:hypothetical protein
MTKPVHMCPKCRHYRAPIQPSAFAPGAVLTGGQFTSATRELEDQRRDREDEQLRFQNNEPFDFPPQAFAWCAKFTFSDEELEELNRRLRAGDHGLVRAVVDAQWARLEGACGGLLRLYRLCQRQNPQPYICDAYEEQS